ncbi:protein of unknown function [Acidithiobacillus ferrivorans]|uniref:Uncharacterized protein n=1 Tax=Acidithiobacillus ferrivorans TaxID=160808 RepID=A0A060UL13_9PROT|nr:hypothetical protein AFERRI_240009 [Acidithiobacillus ferrivorans]SMH64844.1 protein of unknown function [Acidithiobacillus ferrivorans]
MDAAIDACLLGIAGFEAVAVDGKGRKGIVREDGTQVHLLSAFMHGQGRPSRKGNRPENQRNPRTAHPAQRASTFRGKSYRLLLCIPSETPLDHFLTKNLDACTHHHNDKITLFFNTM